MDAFDANLFAAFNVDIEVVHKDGFPWFHSEMLERNLEDLWLRLDRADLGRDDHLVKSIVELFPDDEVPQVTPGIRDQSYFVFATQRPNVLDQRPVDDIASKEFLADEGNLSSRTFQPLDDRSEERRVGK